MPKVDVDLLEADCKMLPKPIGHFTATHPASGEIEHQALLGIDRGIEVVSRLRWKKGAASGRPS